MIILYGTKGCAKCKMVSGVLKARNIEFEYRDFEQLPKEEQDEVLMKATEKHISSFPVLIRGGEALREIPEV